MASELAMSDLSNAVLVVGGGPAGAGAAAALARAGIETWVVDKASFPRGKVCGDGISPLALECLHQVGMDPDAVFGGSYEKMVRVGLVSPGGVYWRPRYPSEEQLRRTCGFGDGYVGKLYDHGYVVPRETFDKTVLDHAIACGARFEAGWKFDSLEREREFTRSITLEGVGERAGERIALRPRFILAADGEHSQIRKALAGVRRANDWLAVRGYVGSLDRPAPDMEFHFTDDVRPGYGWIFPEGSDEKGHRTNVGVYVHTDSLRKEGRNIKKIYDRFISGKIAAGDAALSGGEPCGEPQGYPITSYNPARRLLFGNTLLLGDAAGVADVMTGEGIGPSIYSGIAAAEAVRQAVAAGEEGTPGAYPGLLGRLLLPVRRRGVFMLKLLDHLPFFVDWMFRRMNQDAVLSEKIFEVISGNASITRLFNPHLWARAWLPWVFPRRLTEGAGPVQTA